MIDPGKLYQTFSCNAGQERLKNLPVCASAGALSLFPSIAINSDKEQKNKASPASYYLRFKVTKRALITSNGAH